MVMMNKWVGIWVTRDEVEAILGLDPSGTANIYIIGGKVVGESRGVGLWIQMEFVSEGQPSNNLLANLLRENRRRLVRWEYIRAAELFDESPAMERAAGSQSRAA